MFCHVDYSMYMYWHFPYKPRLEVKIRLSWSGLSEYGSGPDTSTLSQLALLNVYLDTLFHQVLAHP